MPSLDIATVQPPLQNHLVPLRAQKFFHGEALWSPWKSSQLPKNVKLFVEYPHMQRGKLLVKAVATLEPQCSFHKEGGQNNSTLGVISSPQEDQHQTSQDESEELDERERLRRMRISKANKGNTPWNKGRKHSAETLQRIRERTKLAMQNPKVKMKLVNLGHAQSEETKMKIGIGVRMGWEKRRQKLMLQETCYFEWQNLIAEAAREGYVGEQELQWDSYKILDGQLKQEWLESVEQRKTTPRTKGGKRAPKSPEQRRKIAEAIAAKWADPEYRERVCAGLSKYHGVPVGAKRKPKRRPNVTRQSMRGGTTRRNTSDGSSSTNQSRRQIEKLRLQRSNKSPYKDPLVSSKLEMIKNIRAQRASAESKKFEAIERARLLIAEAEKAAKSLEVAAAKSPIAQASLIESRRLIAEAIQSIESIETSQITSNENGVYHSVASAELHSQVEKRTELENQLEQTEVNGSQILSFGQAEDSNFANFTLRGIVNGEKEILSPGSSAYGLPTLKLEDLIKQSASRKFGQLEPNGNGSCEKNPLLNGVEIQKREPNNSPRPNGAEVQLMEEEMPSEPVSVTKKWVRGRLVEVRGT